MAQLIEEKARFEALRALPEFARFNGRPVAYFCAEYAFNEPQRRYAGGLGVLAGDMVREAADLKFPLLAIGLYYREGYICSRKSLGDGQSVEACEATPPSRAGFEPVYDQKGERLHVIVPIHDRNIRCRAWRKSIGQVPVYVLDTNCEENLPADRGITDRLYDNDKETRFKQEIVLGIGGLRLIEALGIHPIVYHLNEGHSAMLALELIHHEMHERHIGFDEAKQFARRRIVLTNHTLVPAGNEVYSYDLATMLLQRYAIDLSVPVHELVKLGLVQQSSEFSLTMLALRMSTIVNAVSRLHAAKAKEIWTDHPMVAVTNGIHVPTWDRIGDDHAGAGSFWARHQEKKKELLDHIRAATGREWSADTLLIGWARRIVRYKRPLAIFEDLKRLADLARAAGRPFKIVISGYAHPNDTDGEGLLKEIMKLTEGELADIAVYLPGYGLGSAGLLVAGCDVWLNTPVVGFEACGTSGMKAALNGVLQLSTKDGWIHEAPLDNAGWILHNDHLNQDIFDRLEKDILPLYYARNAAGTPELWEERMRHSRAMILEQFTATRMFREYVETLYS
ncbi:MAG: alpha-glucan family phosphorylase [Patescibacteria group bacterium]